MIVFAYGRPEFTPFPKEVLKLQYMLEARKNLFEIRYEFEHFCTPFVFIVRGFETSSLLSKAQTGLKIFA